MLLSLNWIKKYTTVTNVDELLQKIALQIAEIESVTHLAERYEGVVVARIISVREHPDADKLRIFDIDAGQADTVQIISGDPALKQGDTVALIKAGAYVPGSYDTKPVKIEVTDMRGHASNGMLGSARELGLSDDHSGVLVFETEAAPGTPLTEVFELDDYIIEIENKSLTHRPDCFGILGIAREVAGIQHQPFSSPDWYQAKPELATGQGLELTIKNSAPEVVHRLTAVAYKNITVEPAPLLMQSYLQRIGIRPINNIVDISNYVMALTGQPTHAFDYDKVAELSSHGAVIEARLAKPGEKLTLLDGRTIEPHQDAIVIATDQTAIGLAGVMGGAETEVTDDTKNIILEVANFNMYSVRATSMQHGIFSEAVTRFTRGQSPEQCLAVQAYTRTLLAETTGAEVASDLFDDYPQPKQIETVATTAEFVNSRLGTALEAVAMADLLKNVELATEVSGDKLSVTPAFWRQDLHIAEDIVEEVGRLHGYASIEATLPQRSIKAVRRSSIDLFESTLRQKFIRAGVNEVLTYNFVSESILTKAGINPDVAFRIRNSISPELQRMRPAMLPGILDKLYGNIRQGHDIFSIFELGKTHNAQLLDGGLPVEARCLAAALVARDKYAQQQDLRDAFYQLKYILNFALGSACAYIPLEGATVEPALQAVSSLFAQQRSAILLVGKTQVGIIGEFNASVRREFKLPSYSAGFELLTEQLLAAGGDNWQYQPLSKYPATDKDVTFVLPAKLSFADLAVVVDDELDKTDVTTTVSTLGIYQPDNSEERNVTLRIVLQSHHKTLTSSDASDVITKLTSAVSEKLGVKTV